MVFDLYKERRADSPMKRKTKRNTLMPQRLRTYRFMMLPGILLYTFFFILPISMGIFYSFTNWNGIGKSYKFIGFENFEKILHNKTYLTVLAFTTRYTLILVIGTVILGVLLALLLNAKIRGRSFFRTLYFIPAVLSMITVSLIFNQIFYRIIPKLGQLLSINVLSTNILSNKTLAMWGILFVHIWQGVALPTLLFLAALQTIPDELIESASIDGAGSIKTFFSIKLYYLLPSLSVVLVLTLKAGLNVFDYIKSLTEGGPGGVTKSIAFLIYEHGFVQNKYSYSIAEAILTGILIASISALQIKFTNGKKVDA